MKRLFWVLFLAVGLGAGWVGADEALDRLKAAGRAAAGPAARLENRFTLGIWSGPDQRYGDRGPDALEDVRRHYLNYIEQIGFNVSSDSKERWFAQIRPILGKAAELDLSCMIHAQMLLSIPSDKDWDFDRAADFARERLLPLKDEKAVLGWYLCDEAGFDDKSLNRILRLKLFLQKEAPDCASVVLLSPAANPTGVRDWAPYLNVMLTDIYAYSMFVDMTCRAVNELTERPHWTTLMSFSYYRGQPVQETAWVRQKVYIALARGAKGVHFYTYGSPSAFEGLGENGMVDPYGNANPPGLWDGLGEMARVLEPVGHVLMGSHAVPAGAIRCACVKTLPAQQDDSEPAAVSPAVEMGVLRDAAADTEFLVVYNNDTRQPSQAAIEILDYYLGSRKVYNLFTLREVPVPAQRLFRRFPVESLDPGDGRIYAVCAPEVFEKCKKDILRRRYENELIVAKLDLDWSRKSGLAVGKAEEQLGKGAEQAKSGDHASAESCAKEAQALLKKALEEDKAVFASYTSLRTAQKSLGRCDKKLAAGVNSLWSLAVKANWEKNKLDPLDLKVKPWIEMMMRMSETYRRLRAMERLGLLGKFAAETAWLAANCAALESGIGDIIQGNYPPAKYDQDALNALHDKCDTVRPERFVGYAKKRLWYRPYNPRTVGIGDTSSTTVMMDWQPYYCREFFANEAEAKAVGLTLKP